ncbi:helix-turn-helix domain-containing protein [Ilumatobacter sp.]|uniref:helix-turn-helix domain-containing protein n=1 Tax=Ilumatobacter sp. TaxID=1967498 RepID=UPI003753B4D6
MTADRHQHRDSLRLGPMADETRRSLGPLAWAALEALVTEARPNGDGDVANTSVRQLAEHLGVAKNTAHRAVTALRLAGFIEPLQSRSMSGQFTSGSYRLAVDPSILRLAPEASAVHVAVLPAVPRLSASRPSRRVPSPSQQLSLLPSG